MRSNHRPRVLCVDDDEDSRVMLTTLLRLAVIDAKAVGTGAQALSSIRAEHFDLYVLDSRLPDVDGFKLCRRMRDFDPDTPILFFSGAAHPADKKRGIKAGATAYVVKPDIAGLLGSVMHFASLAARPAARQSIPSRRRAKDTSSPFIH